MRVGTIQKQTVVASLVIAVAAFVVSSLAGEPALGAGLGTGLVIGSLNGFIIKALLDRGAPVLATSVLRLAFFSMLALVAARLLGGFVWPVVIGIGAAQIVMVGIGVRQGTRA